MSPPSNDAIRIYGYLMEEVKERQGAVARMVTDLRGNAVAFPHYIGAEFCLLQLRMTYELVALGCVVMHGKMGLLREVWQANELIKRLSELHPEFYPQPVQERIEGDTLHVQVISEPFLTKERLIDEYGKLGEKLHRGRASDILFKKKRVYDLDEVVEQLNLTAVLLDHHYIAMAKPGHLVRVDMADPTDGQVKVNAWIPSE